MLINGLKDKKNGVMYGNRSDYCFFCAEELALKNRQEKKNTGINHESAGQQLRGKLSGKPIFRFPISGGPYIICQDHINMISDNMTQLRGNDNEEKNTV